MIVTIFRNWESRRKDRNSLRRLERADNLPTKSEKTSAGGGTKQLWKGL